MEKFKGEFLQLFWHFPITCGILSLSVVSVHTFFPFFRKKEGNSNGSGNFKHLAVEGSSMSDLESEDELQIDETPPPRRKPAGPSKKKKLSG